MHGVILLIACVVLAEARTDPRTDDLSPTILNAKRKKKFTDCVDLRKDGYNETGLYHIYPNTTDPIKVACRFELENTFTSIMGQKDGSMSFQQYFQYYITGFGNTGTNNFWLGLDHMKYLTDIGHVNMRITLQDWWFNIKEIYYKFSLGPKPYYTSYFSHFQGNLPDDLSYESGMNFAAMDRVDPHGCAAQTKAGWWYNYCTYTLPTGRYYRGRYPVQPGKMADGIFYKDWYGVDYSLMYIRIDLAPNP